MSVPTGAGNYPPGVTDNDEHFEGHPDGLFYLPIEEEDDEPETFLDEDELHEPREPRVNPQTGWEE